MLLIAGTVRFPPQHMTDARTVMTTIIVATRAEDGCLRYHFAEDVLDAGLVHISELWRDRVALDRHFATDHVARWRAAGVALGMTGRDLRLYEVGEPRAI